MLDYGDLSLDSCDFAPHSPRRQSRCSRTVIVCIIDLVPIIIGMPAGLKQSSAVVSIGFSVNESAVDTFTEQQIDLNLSPLDREVFVALAINLDAETPDKTDDKTSQVRAALSTTSATTMPSLQDANCLSRITNTIVDTGGNAVSFVSQALETPPSTLEYIGIIATNDFFVSCQGTNNNGAKGVSGKLYGYRAVASADIYAALVQSEVLSA